MNPALAGLAQSDIDDWVSIVAKKTSASVDRAQDVVSEALLVLCDYEHEIRNLSGFVITIAQRRYYNMLRSDQHYDKSIDVYFDDQTEGDREDIRHSQESARPFEGEEHREVLELLAAGYYIEEVSEMTGHSVYYVKKWRKEWAERKRKGQDE